MTEFENQVAEALRTIRFPGGTDGLVALPMDEVHIERIAPRVAAAIAAAGKVAIRSAEDGDRARTAALAALRGER